MLIYLVRLADKLDIDLLQAARDKIVENASKYPVEKAKGSIKKYTRALAGTRLIVYLQRNRSSLHDVFKHDIEAIILEASRTRVGRGTSRQGSAIVEGIPLRNVKVSTTLRS